MLIRKFDPNQPYTVVIYARMSDKKQNDRSPDQQIAEIRRTLKKLKLNWKVMLVYRDDGKKGAFIRKRPQFFRMLTDIYSGAIKVDLILVDTTERFARASEMNAIREKLWNEYGVLLLTANNNFASPLTPEGKIYAAVEAMRSTEENRIKAHHVLRAKRDTIEQGYWPGGKPPRGLVLRKVIENVKGNDQFLGSKAEHDPNVLNVEIIRAAFKAANESGKRGSKLAKHLKSMPQFKNDFKSLTGDTVESWLANTLYKGTLTWGIYCTGIVNDVRRLELNDPEDVIVKEDFCEPIVSAEVWDQVNLGRLSGNAATDNGEGKLLKPLAPGFKIKHMLSGLVRCACCNASMQPVTNKSSTGKPYTYYRCQRTSDGCCTNNKYIHESWLRSEIVGYIQSQILGGFDLDSESESGASDSVGYETTEELNALVAQYLEQQSAGQNDSRPAIKSQIDGIDKQISGWTQSLGQPDLPHSVRRSIEHEFNEAIETKVELEESLAQLEYVLSHKSLQLDNSMVAERMDRLSQVLVDSSPCLTNIELSLHIDKILCYPDGSVVGRFCKLGLAGMEVVNSVGVVEQSKKSELEDSEDEESKCKPRRRARLSASSDLYSTWDLESLAYWATDPHRFDYMDETWFEEVTFIRPRQLCWSEANAIVVAECRLTENLTEAALATKFGVTNITIRKALKIAGQEDPKYLALPRRIPRPRWHEGNAAAVFEASKTMLMKEMVKYFGKSDTTLRHAIKHAKEVLGLS